MRKGRGKRGSIALETAIALPMLLFVAVSILQYPAIVRVGIHIRNAADNAAAEMAMVIAASEAAGLGDYMRSLASGALRDEEISVRVLGVAASLAGSDLLLGRMRYWLSQDKGSDSSLKMASELEADLEGVLSGQEIYLHVRYRLATLTGSRTASFYTYFPVSRQAGGLIGSHADDNVWMLDNLERGRTLRIRNGGNLPMGYPVIAAYREGHAMAIRSMDTTSRSFQSEATVYRELCDEIDLLAAFNGTDKPWGSSRIWIKPGEIRHRELLLVIPVNPIGAETQYGIDKAKAYARQQEILLSIIMQGTAVPIGEP